MVMVVTVTIVRPMTMMMMITSGGGSTAAAGGDSKPFLMLILSKVISLLLFYRWGNGAFSKLIDFLKGMQLISIKHSLYAAHRTTDAYSSHQKGRLSV